MEGIDRIKIIKNISNMRKLRTNTEPHSLNSSSNHSLSFIQCGDGTIKRIRNKTCIMRSPSGIYDELL